MTLRVVQWATGTVGVHAVPAIGRHPDLDLVGLWVHSPDKVGRDAGEICGVEDFGVAATNDVDALLDLKPDAICHTAHSDVRPGAVVEDLCRFLAAGINVVNTSYVALLDPSVAGPGVLDQLEAACREGGSSVYTWGIDPGFGNVGLTVPALEMCERVDRITMSEIVDYATWDNPFTMFEIMGFGKASAAESLLLSPGSTTIAWGPVLNLVATAMGVQLEDITERHEIVLADEEFEIASGTIPVGGIAAMRFWVEGWVGGEPRIILQHVTRLRPGQVPEWPSYPAGGESGYVIEVEGEPSLKLTLSVDSTRGDHNTAGCLATAAAVVNAIPLVCAADPGVLTWLDLPVHAAPHVMTGGTPR